MRHFSLVQPHFSLLPPCRLYHPDDSSDRLGKAWSHNVVRHALRALLAMPDPCAIQSVLDQVQLTRTAEVLVASLRCPRSVTSEGMGLSQQHRASVEPHYIHMFGVRTSAPYRQTLAKIAPPHVQWVVAVGPRHPLAWAVSVSTPSRSVLTLVCIYAARRTMVLAAKWASRGPSARASKWEFACRCFDDTILKE